MQFSDTTNNQGLLQAINFYCGLPLSDTTQYATADKVRNINSALRTVLGWIWKVQGDWIFDDSNHTDLPYFRSNVTSGREDYSLPTGYGVVERIEVKDQSGIWYKMDLIAAHQIRQGLEEYQKTNSIPQRAYLFANSYRLWPAANWTSTDGDSLRVYCTRDIDAFTASDTTQTPGFNLNWHHILAMMAAKDYGIARGKPNLVKAMDLEIYGDARNSKPGLKKELEDYYSSRNNLDSPRMRPRNRQMHAR